ncbi:MAG: hypothetical protein ACOYKN_16210 [Pirellula sp.]
MSGLWMILFLALSQPDELLPAPKNETLPKPLVGSSSTETNQAAADVPATMPDCKIGWGTDPLDRSMYLVIQLPPESIARFAAGGRSMELESVIPPALRGHVQKVIVRVGNVPVEQSPPESEFDKLPALSVSSAASATNANGTASGSPLISNLDMRSPVSIDSPRTAERSSAEIVNTSGTPQLPVVPGLSLPSTPSPVLPPSSIASSTAGLPTTYSTPVAAGPNPSTSQPYGAPATSSYANDGFAPMPRSVPSTLNPFGKSGLANSSSTPQGNVTYSGSSATPAYGPNPNNNGAYSSVPHLASNQNPPAGGYVLPNDSYAGYGQNQNGYVQNGYPQQGYAQNGYAQQGYGNQGITNPVLPIPQVASRPLPSTGTSTTLALPNPPHREMDLANVSPRGSLVPFFLVLSFILNVYFGLWLNHLSTKYRHLLGSVRGLAPSSLDA